VDRLGGASRSGSPTYYGRVLAAREIMQLYRDDPERLQELDLLRGAKGNSEEVLHPPSETERFADASDLMRAWETHDLQPLPTDPGRGSRSTTRWASSLRSSAHRRSYIATYARRL